MTAPVIVHVETDSRGATETSLETLTLARELAARLDDAPLNAVVVGPVETGQLDLLVTQLGDQGVTVLYAVAHEELSAYGAAGWATGVISAVEDASACVVLAAGTPRGSEIMAHVATRLDATMAANIVEVREIAPLVVSRQVMGGAVLELMRVESTPAVLTVAGHAVEPTPADQPTLPEVRHLRPELSQADLVGRVVRVEAGEADDTSALTGARVVVGAGRGAGGADGFGDLLELAGLLHGALGVSRVVTSLGWRPHHEQVGQTGSRIAPDVYIACGISGAIQHWAGMSSAKTIVAINIDPDAPMVTKAHYAVIGDLHEIVPAINEELRRRIA